jgi:hypothetical protein
MGGGVGKFQEEVEVLVIIIPRGSIHVFHFYP